VDSLSCVHAQMFEFFHTTGAIQTSSSRTSTEFAAGSREQKLSRVRGREGQRETEEVCARLCARV
jgi:hypothetical protein